MLRLEDIKKNYYMADMTVEALKGINLCFRKNEFVSILGPSGCGKTTMLNIIGGLDQYTSGDLVINGRSTKEFNDHDWDVYRNHRIGFIFQSYNLIPHQTVLGNVELALTIAGLPKAERIARAKKALDRVGLANQYYKRPNQMSGGQCQRVAIARALVNEPEILLADEPTGALDTETSVQIMELIKEIAKEKLVIMVTHNPDLAYKYSTRIVKCLDGNVIEDSMPFAKEDEIAEIEALRELEEKTDNIDEIRKKNGKERAKMSLATAFRLSARNLQAKFKRTFMVALAGCIGIVGVSTVLAVSNGVQGYISDMENDMLSGNPVYISSSSLDYSTLMGGGLTEGTNTVNTSNDTSKLYIDSLVRTLYNMNGVTSTNEITGKYLKFLDNMPKEACEVVQYRYGYKIAPNLYTDFESSLGTFKMSVSAIQATYASVLNNVEEFKDYSSMINSVTVMTEAPSNAKYIATQYDILYIEDGLTLEDVINSEQSLIAVADQKNNTLNDLELAEYGYFSQDQFLNYCYKVGESDLYVDNPMLDLPETISYETLAKKKFTWYPNDTVYKIDSTNDDDYGDKYYASAYADGKFDTRGNSDYDVYKRDAFADTDSVELNVKCVLKLKSDLSYGCLSSGGLYYTKALTDHMREVNLDSDVANSAKDNGGELYNVEIGYNFRFDSSSSQKVESYKLTSGSSIMSYISQFLGVSGGSSQVTSYTLAALGGEEYPTSIYFYCNDFAQKDLLTTYLDKWNNENAENLYKQNKEGYYVGKVKNADGTEEYKYFYYDVTSDSYYEVKLSESGYALDALGNQYKLIIDEETEKGSFYYKQDDKIGDAFSLEGQIQVMDNYSINAYSLASNILFGKKFETSNIYFSQLTLVPDTGTNLYTYQTVEGEDKYVMKVQNKSYYKMALDKDGNILAVNDGYEKYRYDDTTGKFYKDSYVEKNTYTVSTDTIFKENTYYTKKTILGVDSYPLVETEEEFNQNIADAKEMYIKNTYYELESKEVESSDVKKLYKEDKVYSYANVVKNPTYTINGDEYTLDTKGLYMDMSSITDLASRIHVDMDNHIITLTDYSDIDFYYLDKNDTEYSYYYVDFGKEVINGTERNVLKGKDVSSYLGMMNLGDSVDLSSYVSTKYIINSDGSLQAVSESFDDAKVTAADMVSRKLIRDKLTDLSILEKDDSLKIKYTDMIGLIISMVNTLINVITYALVAFTGLSLVVSTVMIGIITYVSVVERTKEIGVIRALGGRKKDVSHLFNAEALIIGLSSGVLGIVITYLLSLIINLIIGSLSGIYTIASLPWYEAIIMILISVLLTSISGIIPASSAAKKDPVIALRTE